MSRILYHERKEFLDDTDFYPRDRCVTQFVEVEVRSWTCEGMTPDVVIEARVMVARGIVVKERKVYDHGKADAWFIRKGIQWFNDLIDAHPHFSQADQG